MRQAGKTLKHQRQREIENSAERPAVVVEGLAAARERLYAAEAFYKIINYDVVHRDLPVRGTWAKADERQAVCMRDDAGAWARCRECARGDE